MDLTDPLIWPAQTKKHLPKKNSIRTQEKQIFKGTKFLYSPERTDYLHKEKNLIITRKNNQFSKQKIFFILVQKKQIFKRKTFLINT